MQVSLSLFHDTALLCEALLLVGTLAACWPFSGSLNNPRPGARIPDISLGMQMLKSPNPSGGRTDGHGMAVQGTALTAEQKLLVAKVKLHVARP